MPTRFVRLERQDFRLLPELDEFLNSSSKVKAINKVFMDKKQQFSCENNSYD